jgi:hypothetical protein
MKRTNRVVDRVRFVPFGQFGRGLEGRSRLKHNRRKLVVYHGRFNVDGGGVGNGEIRDVLTKVSGQ